MKKNKKDPKNLEKPGKLKKKFNKLFSRKSRAEAYHAGTNISFWAGLFMWEPTIFITAWVVSGLTETNLKSVNKDEKEKIEKVLEKMEKIEEEKAIEKVIEEEKAKNNKARAFSHFKPNKPSK